MAQQTIQVGAAPNDNNGDFIRDAFIKVNENFTELYTDDAGDVNSVNGQTGTVVLDSDDIAEGSTNEYYTEAKVSANTSVAANTAKVSNANHNGDVTGSTTLTIAADAVDGTKIADDSIDSEHYVDGSIDTAHIADNQITHAKLEARYTEAVTVSTLAGTYSLDWSAGAVFVMSGSLTGGITFQFSNMKIGQVIDIYNLTGAQTVTFSTASGTPVFNKAGAVDYAGASTNLIQVQCVSDAANAVFNYAVSAYVSDSTPS